MHSLIVMMCFAISHSGAIICHVLLSEWRSCRCSNPCFCTFSCPCPCTQNFCYYFAFACSLFYKKTGCGFSYVLLVFTVIRMTLMSLKVLSGQFHAPSCLSTTHSTFSFVCFLWHEGTGSEFNSCLLDTNQTHVHFIIPFSGHRHSDVNWRFLYTPDSWEKEASHRDVPVEVCSGCGE